MSVKKFLLRIDEGLWKEIKSMADAKFGSINGEIEELLRDAVKRRRKKIKPSSAPAPDPDPPALEELD